MTEAEIAALAELAERATPGPWWFDFDWSTGEMRPGVEAESAPVDKHYVFFAPFDASEPLTPRKEQPLNDCYFIAAANPSTIKRLIASHAALRAENERMREALCNLVAAYDLDENGYALRFCVFCEQSAREPKDIVHKLPCVLAKSPDAVKETA